MDPFAMQAANALVGNPADAAVIEFTSGGVTFAPLQDCLIAVCGPGFDLQVREWSMPLWMALIVRKRWIVRVTHNGQGNWGYLAIAGGIDVPEMLGSRATYLRGRLGGLEGGVIHTEAVLPIGAHSPAIMRRGGRKLNPKLLPAYSQEPVIHVLQDSQEERFTPQGINAFYRGGYRVSIQSDRMGYRLEGPIVEHRSSADILSEGLVMGAIQIPADGQPIIMMSDHPTTGGYTRIAAVTSADLPLVAQAVAEQNQLHFQKTTLDKARAAFLNQRSVLEQI
jgi:antagonist of KipI